MEAYSGMGSGERQNLLCTYLAILVVVTVIDLLLARFAVISSSIALGVSGLYFSVPFMILFALWFGGWGAIAAYIGCFVGAGMLAGMPTGVNIYWSLADLWQVLIPLLAFKISNVDVALRTGRDIGIFLVFGWIMNNVVGAAWGASTLALGGIVPWSNVPSIFVGWLIGNLMVTIAVAPLLLRLVTPLLQRRGVLVKDYWF